MMVLTELVFKLPISSFLFQCSTCNGCNMGMSICHTCLQGYKYKLLMHYIQGIAKYLHSPAIYLGYTLNIKPDATTVTL